jgi:hypothetical protein
MPVYHLTTPTSDSEYSTPEFNPYTPTSAAPLAVVQRGSVTDKWLDDVVKYTLAMETPERTPERRNMNVEANKTVERNMNVERKNTLDIRRHRVFRTSLESHSREEVREMRSITPVVVMKEKYVEEPLSWIATEIFDSATLAAEEMKLKASVKQATPGKEQEMQAVEVADDQYDDIESLIGDYLEDIKVAGSDSEGD